MTFCSDMLVKTSAKIKIHKIPGKFLKMPLKELSNATVGENLAHFNAC